MSEVAGDLVPPVVFAFRHVDQEPALGPVSARVVSHYFPVSAANGSGKKLLSRRPKRALATSGPPVTIGGRKANTTHQICSAAGASASTFPRSLSVVFHHVGYTARQLIGIADIPAHECGEFSCH